MRNLWKVSIIVAILFVAVVVLVLVFGVHGDNFQIKEQLDFNNACVKLMESNCTLSTDSLAAGLVSLQELCQTYKGVAVGDINACKQSCGCK